MSKKFFNTAGPCEREVHYFVEKDSDCATLMGFIERMKYFIHYAPRQSGKTTFLIDFCQKLNTEGKYTCLYVNLEVAQEAKNNVGECACIIVKELYKQQKKTLPEEKHLPDNEEYMNPVGVQTYLSDWTRKAGPTILIMDEIGSLNGDGLVSLLRQLRAGHASRPELFPQSVILSGKRDLCNYPTDPEDEKNFANGGYSFFNMRSDPFRMSDFSLEQVKELFDQHTKEHGQKFANGVVEKVYELTCGQPWLCNALGDLLCFRLFPEKTMLNMENFLFATEKLMSDKEGFLGELSKILLNDERVKNIITPLIAGENLSRVQMEDWHYCIDLGIFKPYPEQKVTNPFYKEMLLNELCRLPHLKMPENSCDYIEGKRLLMDVLMQKFVAFYRENALEKMFYHEITPHILLMAFLQRIINGGGQLIREYALGRKRLDLGIIFGPDKFAIEIKVKEQEKTWGEENGREKSLTQLSDYMDSLGINENGYLVVFSRDFTPGWEGRFRDEKIEFKGKKIHVFDL